MKIEDLTSEGDGVGTLDGKKVFVEGALPGEEVEMRITLDKKRFSKAKLLKVVKESDHRVKPICPLFGTCGGCQLMHLSYPQQLIWKQKRVTDALRRLGDIDIEVQPCVPSPQELHYRNKIHLRDGGFYKKRSHSTVRAKRCYIFKDMPLHREREEVIRTSRSGEMMHIINGEADCSFITETLGDLKFKIRPRDFFQVNPAQAEQLYTRVMKLAEVEGADVLDAYCGVGTLSLFAAQKAKSVFGIECIRSAVESAKENAKLNALENVTFVCDYVEDRLPLLADFDVTFINPPREGVDPIVLSALIKHPPKRLVYISCDPATLARDLKALKEHFTIEHVEPFDMFPQTTHVETIAILASI